MTISHIDLLSIPVSEPDKAKAWYVDVLGFRVVRDTHMGPAQRWIQLAPVNGTTSVTLVTWFESMPPGSLRGLVLESDDVDAEAAALAARGAEVGPIQEAPWGRYITLHDPDGNGILVQTTAASFAS